MTASLVVWLCVALCVGIGVSPLASTLTIDPQGPRAKAMRRAEQQFASAVMMLATCGLLSLWLVGKKGEMWWPLFAMVCMAIPLVHPWLVVRGLFIPLGLARAAVRVSRLGGHPWFRDPVGGAVLAGVLAALHRGKHDPALARWLRVRLAEDRIGGAGIVALGLLAAESGDRETARVVLGSLDEIEPDICPPLARAIALDWLAADAARRGAWHELVDRIADDPFPTRTTRFVGLCARRMVGESVDRGSILWAWLMAPRRLATFGLVWSCLRERAAPERVLFDDELAKLAANDGREPVLTALALHAEAAALPTTLPVHLPIVERLAAGWDEAFADFGLRGEVRGRAEHFSTEANGEMLVARLQRAVARDLAALLSQCGREAEGVRADAGVLRRARELHFEDATESLARACKELARRRGSANLEPAGAWVEWVRVRRTYVLAAVPLAPAQRGMLYAVVEQELRQLAAWLWNERAERGLAHAVCLFLLHEAEHVRDGEAAAYYRHNVVVGL
jgi:hypothetical protein